MMIIITILLFLIALPMIIELSVVCFWVIMTIIYKLFLEDK